jgi:hypothetical protein
VGWGGEVKAGAENRQVRKVLGEEEEVVGWSGCGEVRKMVLV